MMEEKLNPLWDQEEYDTLEEILSALTKKEPSNGVWVAKNAKILHR